MLYMLLFTFVLQKYEIEQYWNTQIEVLRPTKKGGGWLAETWLPATEEVASECLLVPWNEKSFP